MLERNLVLFKAIRHNHVPVAKYLLEHGANVNEKDNDSDKRSPLHCSRSVRMTEILIEHKADVNAQNKNGDPPLFSSSDVETVKLLIANKANLKIVNKFGRKYSDFPNIKQLVEEASSRSLKR